MEYRRNPFKMRASEHIESEELFLRLFNPDILTYSQLKSKKIWERIFYIRSSPGGGKTTLLRLFTPSSLLTLYRLRSSETFKELFNIVREIGAIDNEGPKVLGVYIHISQSYSSLDDLEVDNHSKNIFLYSLFNSKMILSTLRSLCELKNINYPDDLEKIVFKNPNPNPNPHFDSSPNISGKTLYNWAIKMESSIYDTLNSISSKYNLKYGADKLFFDILFSSRISINGIPIREKLILLFDDFHKLTKRQRKVFDDLIKEHITYGIWFSERYQALDFVSLISNNIVEINEDISDEGYFNSFLNDDVPTLENIQLDIGAKKGRDYEELHLEKMWRKTPKKFRKNVMDIANLRLKVARDSDVSYFEDLLDDSLDDINLNKTFSKAIDIISNRVESKIGKNSKYSNWINAINNKEGTIREKAIDWRNLEIIIEREVGNEQRTLIDLTDEKLSQQDYLKKDDSSIRAIAEFFLANEFGLSYYYGPEILAKLAHLNVEQFLSLAGDEFEEIIGNYRIKKKNSLSPKRQHEIIKKSAGKKWSEIEDGIAYTKETKWFLEKMGLFLKKETFNPKASYLSVTGIGIRKRDISQLNNKNYRKLIYTLHSCLANNLLEALWIPQGGDKYLVLYLNRLLCVKFNLQLSYGGWRHKKLNELNKWVEGVS